MAESFWKEQDKLSGHDQNPVNLSRHEIYQFCLAAAESPPGIFRLSIPTGGGKTLSGMAFALRHALRYQKQRIIVAIPYTSIIDQTAQIYRRIFERRQSWSTIAPWLPRKRKKIICGIGGPGWRRRTGMRLLWSCSVPFFESLFSNRQAACRKLHNLAEGIIILDEVQTLPTGLLAPILEVVQDLVDYYGVTVVLSTATQPSLVDSGSPYLTGFAEKSGRSCRTRPHCFGAQEGVC